MRTKKMHAKRVHHRLSFEEALARREATARRHPHHAQRHPSGRAIAVDEGPAMIRFTDVGGSAA